MDEQEARAVLGLPPSADHAAAKRAYRRLARELHPDAGGDADAFHRVRAAYEVVGSGTSAPSGPAPQARAASVDERWWDAGSVWHDAPVDRVGVRLDVEPPDEPAVRADLDLLASLLHGEEPVRPVVLHSRSPGSRLHRVVQWLQPDLLAQLHVGPAREGRRPGHDVLAEVRSAGGRGRRLLADARPPTGWTTSRGSETVRCGRRLRPCRAPGDTAVRVAREVAAALDDLGWPLGEWFLLRV